MVISETENLSRAGGRPVIRRAVFMGVARDCAESLPRVLENLDRFAALYDEAAFVFVVSDSSDSTAATLQSWTQARHQGVVLDLGDLRERLPARTARLAYVRNVGLEELRRQGWSDYCHLIVSDLDNVMEYPVSKSAFFEAAKWLDNAAERAGVFANSTPRYYDIWALRHDVWCPDDCWHAIWGRGVTESFDATKMREVHARQIVIPSESPPIPVRSAFGGLGIYKLRYVEATNYAVNAHAEFESSEHVNFNEQIGMKGGTLHIFPNLLVRAPSEHLFQPSEMSYYLQLRMHRMEFDERRQSLTHHRF